MNIGAVLAVLSVGALLTSQPASAFGALAVGVAADVARSGFAYGINVNAPTEAMARETALSDCRGTNPNSEVHSESSKPARALSTVVTTFRHKCAVVAQDPAAGTPGVGWAVALTLEAATQQAIDNCTATAGESRKQFCARDAYNCDTK
jgi:hypothetical protein